MNVLEQHNNSMVLGWNALNASTRDLYGSQVIDHMEQACCGFFVAFSIMTTAVFAAYSEWC